MIRSSLNSTGIAIAREIDSKYDVIRAVSEHLEAIETINTTDIVALIAELEAAQDFTGITVVAGSVASWNPETKVITVPTVQGVQGPVGPAGPTGARGLQGVQGYTGSTGASGVDGVDGRPGYDGVNGLNGMVPILEFSIDNDGDLAYEVIGYEEGPAVGERYPDVQEW